MARPIAWPARALVLVACAAAAVTADAASSFKPASYLGSSMVLRASDASQKLWGFAAPGVTVTASLGPHTGLQGVADASGLWTIALPATPPSGPHNATLTSSDGGAAAWDDIYFGLVISANGQSNMDMPVSYAFNASAEIAASAAYPLLRYKYVAVNKSATPQREFPAAPAPWAPASTAPGYAGSWSAFGWYTARDIYNALGGGIAVGVVHSALGGTPIQAWTPPSAAADCVTPPNNFPESVLYNAMIAPMTTPGAALFDAFLWVQGEQNAEQGQDAYYRCALPALINSWRTLLSVPTAGFFVTQLHPWNATTPGMASLDALPRFRLAQAGLDLPLTAVVPQLDGGDPQAPATSIHPRGKQTPAARLANAALAITFGKPETRWKAPTYAGTAPLASVRDAASGAVTVGVTVSFEPDTVEGGLTFVPPAPASNSSRCPTDLGIPAALCSWFGVQLGATGPGSAPLNGTWVNATGAIAGAGGTQLTLQAVVPGVPAGVTVTPIASSNGFSGWPVVNFYAAATDLPVMPWLASL